MNKLKVSLIAIALVVALFSTAKGLYTVSEYRNEVSFIGSLNPQLDPLYQTIDSLSAGAEIGTGEVWYVDSGVSGGAGTGLDWDNACTTLDAAINLCSTDGGANRGDIIYVAQGHAESGSDPNWIDVDVAGLTIINLGNQDNAPTYTWADTDATFTIGDSGVKIIGGRYLAGISAVVIGFWIENAADDVVLDQLYFPEPTTSSFEFVRTIFLSGGADRCTIQNCIAFCADATGATNWLDMDDDVQNGTRILYNWIYGEYAEGPIHSDDIDLDVFVWGNCVTNLTTGQHAIEFTAAARGMYGANFCFTDAEATSIDPGSMYAVAPNWITTAIDASPVMFPAQDDTAENLIGVNDNNNAATTNSVVSNHDGSILERLEGILQQVNDANALAAHALPSAPINDSIAGYIGFDNNNNAGETDNVVSNHDGSILERLEGILLAVNDANAMAAHALPSAPINDSIAGYIGFDNNNNAAETDNVVSNHNGSILERLEGIYLAVNDSNALAAHALPSAPINDSIAGYIGYDNNNNLAETDNVVSNHDGSILERLTGIQEAVLDANALADTIDTSGVTANHNGNVYQRLEGILQAVNDANALAAHALPSAPINDSIAGYIGYDNNNNLGETDNVVSNHDGSILERLEGILQAVNDANALTQHAVSTPANDTVMGMIGFDDNNNNADTSNVVSNHDGSILERIQGILEAVLDANALADTTIDTSGLSSDHDGNVYERLEGILLAVNDANALAAHALPSAPINDSIAGYIGYDNNNNAGETDNVVSNHDGSILERLEGILQAVNDGNAITAHAMASAPVNDSIAGLIGYDDNNNAADTQNVVSNHDGSILERLQGILEAVLDANALADTGIDTSGLSSDHDGNVYERLEGILLEVRDANALTQQALPGAPINDSVAGMLGYDDNNNAFQSDNVVSNHDGSILERLEGILQAVNDGNAITAHAMASAPVNDSIAGLIGYDDNNNAADTSNVVVNDNGSILERMEGLMYWQQRTVSVSVDEVTADLFDVAGGDILITSMIGYVSVQIGANATTCKLQIDRDDAAADTEFTTAVGIETDVVGTAYIFTSANPAALTPITPGANGSSNLMSPWYCPEGMVEQVMSADPGGAAGDHITWFMTYIPLESGVTVTAQ